MLAGCHLEMLTAEFERRSIDADIGLFDRPFTLEGVWIGWGRAIRKRLEQDAGGNLPVADIAKHLAAQLRPG